MCANSINFSVPIQFNIMSENRVILLDDILLLLQTVDAQNYRNLKDLSVSQQKRKVRYGKSTEAL